MIYIDVTGRCGNQLFQYAFARKLSILNKDNNLVVDFFHTNRVGAELKNNSFVEELCNFNVLKYNSLIDNGNNVLGNGSKKQIKLYRKYSLIRKISFRLHKLCLLQRFQYRMQRNGIFKEDECLIKPVIVKSKDIFIRGYFERPEYFNDIKQTLIKEFTPIHPRKDKNKKLYEIIDNAESVCVSFRVWNEISGDLLKQRNVCTTEYYLKAIEKMHKLYPDAVFIVFSNDIAWAKRNIRIKYPVYYEDGDDEVWEKLRLMYSCKHFIMSTSTFSWWAQYLSRNEHKTVISPNKWYADGKNSHLLDRDWIKIEV